MPTSTQSSTTAPASSLRHTGLPQPTRATASTVCGQDRALASSADWRTGLPELRVQGATLRELRMTDAPALLETLASEHVTRFISPPPTTVQGFERFIAWTAREQAEGRYICFGVVAEGSDCVVGIIQIRQLEPQFRVGEWGFALGVAHWGTGLFQRVARTVIDFAFTHVGVHRLEARAAVVNGRGNGALRKLGATPEALLRKSFLKDGEYLDQMLWGLVASEWLSAPSVPRIH